MKHFILYNPTAGHGHKPENVDLLKRDIPGECVLIDVTAPEGRFSLNDKVEDILSSKEGEALFVTLSQRVGKNFAGFLQNIMAATFLILIPMNPHFFTTLTAVFKSPSIGKVRNIRCSSPNIISVHKRHISIVVIRFIRLFLYLIWGQRYYNFPKYANFPITLITIYKSNLD